MRRGGKGEANENAVSLRYYDLIKKLEELRRKLQKTNDKIRNNTAQERR